MSTVEVYNEVYSSGNTPRPAYVGLTDQQIADLLNAQTVAETGPADWENVRELALTTRFSRAANSNTRSIWGSLRAMADRPWSEGTQAADHAKNDVIIAAHSFLSVFQELTETPFVRGNALWTSVSKDLEILSNTKADNTPLALPASSGSPIMTFAQAEFVRSLGDRTRPKWSPELSAGDIQTARATYSGIQ